MISIKEIEVLDLYSTKFLQVKFTINDTSEDIAVYKFNLYKSNSAQGPYTVVAPDVKDFSYIDYDVNLFNSAINYYYKVEIVDKDGNKAMSDVYGSYKGKDPDVIAQTIVYNYEEYLKNIVHNDMILLQRKHNGQLCDVCYDKIRRRASNQNCPICYATKYTGGYFAPVPIKVSLLNSPAKVETFTISDTTEDVTPIQAWAANFPVVHVNDVLVDRNNDRFVVTNWQPTYKDYYLIKQVFQMQKLPKSDIVYTFPVTIE